jgi:hypothetical protein
MFYKTSFLLLPLLLSLFVGLGQVTNLDENKPVVINGIEYGYIIRNEQSKTVKDEDYGRFEITLYTTNQSGCTKLYSSRVGFISDDALNLIATFNCTNANGKRLTAKGGTVKARDFFVNAKVNEGGKEISRTVNAGYIFRNGETIKTNIIVLVPKGDRPVMNCTLNNLPELQ